MPERTLKNAEDTVRGYGLCFPSPSVPGADSVRVTESCEVYLAVEFGSNAVSDHGGLLAWARQLTVKRVGFEVAFFEDGSAELLIYPLRPEEREREQDGNPPYSFP